MSVESLIFLAIFFLLPLIERLLERNRRKRHPIPPPAPPRPDAGGRDDPILPPLPRPQPPVEPAPPPSRPIPLPPPVPTETRRPDPPRPAPSRAPAPAETGRPDTGPRPVPAPQKRPKQKPQDVPQPKAPQSMPDEVLQAMRARERALAQAQRTAAANVASTRVRRAKTQTLNRILRNPRSLRQAILAAEVLGPCKAQDRRA